MSGVDRRAFSLGWVVVSYFLALGGIAAAMIAGYALGVRERMHAYAVIAAGAAIGGLFAGRASPHRSVLEPALAGALIVGSLIAFMSRTMLGQMLYAYTQDTMWREAAIVAGVALGGGLVGAVVGELSAPDQPSHSALRWIGMTVLATAGALLASMIVSYVLLVDRALREGGIVEMVQGKQLVDLLENQEIVRAGGVSLAAGALLGGLVTQAAAPRRLFLAIGFAVAAAYAAMMLAAIDPRVPHETKIYEGVAVIAAAGAILAIAGAVVGRIVSRVAH